MKVEIGFNGINYYMLYTNFTIGDKNSGYIWNYTFVAGNISDDLSNIHHKNSRFTTFDKDQDASLSNCATIYGGGWWYGFCHSVHPTGSFELDDEYAKGVVWIGKTGAYASLDWIEFKIRQIK